jgi:hypothetical protein
MKFTPEQLANYFDYFDTLRDSEITNMFMAPAYLVREYSIKREIAKQAFMLWANTYDNMKTLGDRVNAAMENQDV